MKDVDGTLTCVAGNMPLAKVVQNYLMEHFPVYNPRPSGISLGLELARWFCPGCGVHLQDLACPRCGGSIRSMHHSLVERHFHEGELQAFQKWKAQQDSPPNRRPADQAAIRTLRRGGGPVSFLFGEMESCLSILQILKQDSP